MSLQNNILSLLPYLFLLEEVCLSQNRVVGYLFCDRLLKREEQKAVSHAVVQRKSIFSRICALYFSKQNV